MGKKAIKKTIRATKTPQVMFLGNGLNNVFGGLSWTKMMETINDSGVDVMKLRRLPFPLQAVIGTKDHVDTAAEKLQREFMAMRAEEPLCEEVRHLCEANFDSIITTNYTYEIEQSLDRDFISRGRCYDTEVYSSLAAWKDPKYLLHSAYHIQGDGKKENLVWHIHGEARKPDTMIFGHYFYGNLLSKFQQYLEKRSIDFENTLRHGVDLEMESWLDYYILGDIYILGFGFDVSELDMWWLLAHKKQMEHSRGTVYFFDPHFPPALDEKDEKLSTAELLRYEKEEMKYQLLRAYGVEIRHCPKLEEGKDSFAQFYDRATLEILDLVAKNREKTP